MYRYCEEGLDGVKLEGTITKGDRASRFAEVRVAEGRAFSWRRCPRVLTQMISISGFYPEH
jgi:hypothetical protein